MKLSQFGQFAGFSWTVLVLVSVLDTSRAQQGDGTDGNTVSTCPLQCQYETTCVQGDLNVSGLPIDPVTGEAYLHPETNAGGWICDCPPDLTGIRCGRKFASCNSLESQGCYHGGECLQGVTDRFGNDQFYCNCNGALDVAVEDKRDNFMVTQYVGRFCEQVVTTADKCGIDTGTNNINRFCINGGTCRSDDADNVDLKPCDCPSNTTGAHCEYTIDTVPLCSLDCGEHGSCRLGRRPLSAFELQLGVETHRNHMYCACRRGFTGFLCDAPAVECGNSASISCLNGGVCEERSSDNGSDFFWACNCSGVKAAGKFCQYNATDTCENPVFLDTDDHHNFSFETNGFCVNQGVCHEKAMTAQLYCDCPNQTITGSQCEIVSNQLGESDQSSLIPSASPAPTPNTGGNATSLPTTRGIDDASGAPSPSTMSPTAGASPNALPEPSPVAPSTMSPTSDRAPVDRLDLPTQQSSSSSANATVGDDLPSGAVFGIVLGGVAFAVVAVLFLRGRRRGGGRRSHQVENAIDVDGWHSSEPLSGANGTTGHDLRLRDNEIELI
jgi:hypothetical protein